MGPKELRPKLKRLKGLSSSSKQQGQMNEILGDDHDAAQGNEQVVRDNAMQADDIHVPVPAPILLAVQHCNDMDAPSVASDPVVVLDEDRVPDEILPPLHVQVVDANRQQRIQTAVASLEDLARSHHRARTTADRIIEVLPFLCFFNS